MVRILAARYSPVVVVVADGGRVGALPGVAGAGALRTPVDRQAYAIDHLGMSFETWRKVRTAGYWKSPNKSTANVPDLSAFRLLTNFVRSKRMGQY